MIFHSYVSLPEGKKQKFLLDFSESPFVFRIACQEIMKPKLHQITPLDMFWFTQNT